MENDIGFVLDLILILIATNIGGLIAFKLKQPSVLGQILAGLIIGPAILNLVSQTEFITNIAEIGVILIMFMAGMETNIDEMKESALSSSMIALGGMVAPFVFGFIAVKLLFSGEGTYQAIFTGVILTATSISITVQTLREIGKLKDKTGVNIIGAAIVDDIGGIILLTVIVGMSDPTKDANVFLVILKVAVFFAISLVVAKFIKLFMNKYLNKVSHYVTSSSIALICCLIFAYSASLFEIAAIIGAYVAGLIFSIIPNNRRIEQEINVICYMIFTPMFFVNIGLGVSFENIGTVILPATIIIIAAITGKILGSGLGAKISKFSNKQSLQVGIGMVPRGEVALITANLGRNAGMINDTIFTSIILLTIVSSVITPILLKKAYALSTVKKNDKLEKSRI